MNPQIRNKMKVMLALTYDCPCKCSHCGVASYKNKNRTLLNKEEILDILNQINSLGVEYAYFFGGEPLLDKNIYEYIAYAKSLGLKTMIDTNGIFLDKKSICMLSQAGLDMIGISLDSGVEEEHDQLRGLTGLYRKNLENALYCKSNKISVYFSVFATKENLRNGQFGLLVEIGKKLDVPLRIFTPVQSGRLNMKKEAALTKEDELLLKKYLVPGKVYWERREQCFADCSFLCAFYQKWFMHISAYGDVQPCCFLPISFGNVREEKIAQILNRMWDSKMFKSHTEAGATCPANSDYVREIYKLDELSEYPKKVNY